MGKPLRKIGGIVSRAVGRPEVVRGARAWAVMARWPEVVGEGLAARSEPDRFEHGTVWVAVRGSEWAQELRLMKETILERLNALADERLFTDLRFGVRKAKPHPAIAAPAPAPAPPADEGDWRDGLPIAEIARRRLAGEVEPG